MAENNEVPSAAICGSTASPSLERQSLKLCLSSKAKPGSWTVSPPKRNSVPAPEVNDVQWLNDEAICNRDPKQSGNLPSLESSPSLPDSCKFNLSVRGSTSPNKNSDMGQVSTESEDDHDGYFDQEEINAVVTSVDHSGSSPRIKIEMSPRGGRLSPRSSGGFSPRLPGSVSPRVSARGLSPHATRFARVSASSPTSVKIVFLKNEQKEELMAIPDGLKSPFKKPRGAKSPRALASSASVNAEESIMQITNLAKPPVFPKNECLDSKLSEPNIVEPLKISKKEITQIRQSERGSLNRSESGDSDDLPRLEKVVDMKKSKYGFKKAPGSESGDDGFGDYDEMPDDLSRHSSVDRYLGNNNNNTPVYDSHSSSSSSPPSLDRMSSGESEGPPQLAKMCCSGSQCHKSLGALGLHCLGSPKDTGVSPQYLECGGAREEAASIGEGSPPSDVEHTNKGHDMSHFILCTSSPSIPSDQEGCQKAQTVSEHHISQSHSPAILPSPLRPSAVSDGGGNNNDFTNGNPKPISGFLGEFAKFVANKTVVTTADVKGSPCQDNHSASSKPQHFDPGKSSEELTADNGEIHDDKYNLRPKKRKSGNSICECCQIPSPKKTKLVNPRRFQENMLRVLHLRHRVCVMFQTVFPDLRYPHHFREDTSVVEELMDHVIEAAKENQHCQEQCNKVNVSWDPQVVLCKSPRKCLLSLRQKICRLLLAVLPTLQLGKDFDRGSRNVDKLLDDVIFLNSEDR